MELKMQPYSIPEAVSFNYEELKTALIEKAKLYESIVYSDDQIKFAKEDRAGLNRLKKALNDERIRLEREYMQPLATFKAQINDIITIIDKPVQAIDKQVKAFDEQKKADKMTEIANFFNSCDNPAGIKLEQIMDIKWLNASVSMKSIQDTIDAKFEQIEKDLSVIRSLPAYAFEAEQEYISTLDLAKAVREANKRQEMDERKAAYEAEQAKRKADQEATIRESRKVEPVRNPDELPAEPIHEAPEREWIAFQALLSIEEAAALGNYFKTRGIKYKAI